MKLRTFLIIPAVIAFLYALGLIFMPVWMASFYGIGTSPGVSLVAQFFGGALLTVGLITWLAKDLTGASVQPVITGSLIGDAVGTILALMGTLSGVMNSTGWSAVVIYFLLTLGFAYFQFIPPAK
jgi:hypothetical protein